MDLELRYTGRALAEGRMSARDLGPAILSMAEMLERTSELLYPAAAPLRVDVNGNFREGSFKVHFVAGSATEMIGNLDLEQLSQIAQILGISGATTVAGLFLLIRKLRGKKPEVTENPDGSFNISTQGGDVNLTLNKTEYKVFADPRVRAALEGLVEPLRQPGIEALEIGPPNHGKVIIAASEARFFAKSLTPGAPTNRQVITAPLILRSPDFAPGKWRFDMGGNQIYADMLDEGYLATLERDGQRFGTNDRFLVDLQIDTTESANGFKYSYAVLKVHEHRISAREAPHPSFDFDAAADDPQPGGGGHEVDLE